MDGKYPSLFPPTVVSLSFSLSRRACVFAVLAAWRECGMERGYRTCVCGVCVCEMKRVTKGKRGEMECVWALAC